MIWLSLKKFIFSPFRLPFNFLRNIFCIIRSFISENYNSSQVSGYFPGGDKKNEEYVQLVYTIFFFRFFPFISPQVLTQFLCLRMFRIRGQLKKRIKSHRSSFLLFFYFVFLFYKVKNVHKKSLFCKYI